MGQIEIIFNDDGTSEMKVNNIKGGKCKDITKAFEKALGTTVGDRKTPEYYQDDKQNNIIKRT